jgi:uncharacterized protein (UPF0305 family)
MNVNELRQLIKEAVDDVKFEETSIEALTNIETWARNAKRHVNNKQNPQVFYRLVKAIADKATQLMNGDIQEAVDHSYNEDDEVRLIRQIHDTAKKALGTGGHYHQANMQNGLAVVESIANELLKMHNVQEGYGTGPNDPKAAGNWKVHYPSEKDWQKNKKSLSAVYQQQESK